MAEQGDRYHLSRDCPGLVSGQRSAEAQEGYEPKQVIRFESAAEAAARALTHQACRHPSCGVST